VFFYLILGYLNLTQASTNIDTSSYWAWNDVINWVDFYSTNSVMVYANRVEGYASSSAGYIAFNCNSTPSGNICSGPSGNWKITNDGNGNLSGWAWNDSIGWISFDSTTASSSFPYQVTINSTTGDFSGWAWNDVVGWISFNCIDVGICGTSNYYVKTSWTSAPIAGYLYSSIFDTQVTGGASINSIIWKGSLNGGSVSFQVASSNNSVGPWNYMGPDGSASTFYTANPNTIIPINLSYHNNQRYVRYKVIIQSDSSQTQTPIINDIIINWGQ
jgi:hypothetical protein